MMFIKAAFLKALSSILTRINKKHLFYCILLIAVFISAKVILCEIAHAEKYIELKLLYELNQAADFAVPLGKNKIVIVSKAGTIQTLNIESGQISALNISNKAVKVYSVTKLQDERLLLTGLILEPANQLKPFSKIYIPNMRIIKDTNPMKIGRHSYTATLLDNGKILIAGGEDLDKDSQRSGLLSSLEIFDPATERYTLLDSKFKYPHIFHTATKLSDGRVLFGGGLFSSDKFSEIEIYSQSKNIIEDEGQLPIELRKSMTAYPLNDDRLLLLPKSGKAQIYDVKDKRITILPGPICGKDQYGIREQTILKLDQDSLLIMGGYEAVTTEVCHASNIFSQKTNEFMPVKSDLSFVLVGAMPVTVQDQFYLIQGKKVYKLIIKGY